ncbi:MAG TPA: VanZ family protein [Thermoanaerobaculia bacterium]|nr:VanZ family protein [Thermoanaerobaculia bacterium]
MGKSEIRTIEVPPPVSAALLLLVSGVMLALVRFLSGRAYAGEPDTIVRALGNRPLSREVVLAISMPIVADVLLFVPWGFLFFVLADRPPLRRPQAYALTFLGGLLFASSILMWQSFLPSRITTAVDAVAQALGALCGAALAHLRRQVRMKFEA